jgi:uncharacterized protein YneF (UPF0154 family)
MAKLAWFIAFGSLTKIIVSFLIGAAIGYFFGKDKD